MPKQSLINQSIIYFALTLFISWGLVILFIGPKNIPIDPVKSQDILPLLYTVMLLGPSIAGILLIALVNGKQGLRELWAKMIRVKFNIRCYLFALLFTPVLATVILLILSVFSTDFLPAIIVVNKLPSTISIGLVTGLMVGIFEEIGWTGFLVPQLKNRFNLLLTGIFTGILWGAWHFILFWEADSFLAVLPLVILLSRLFAWLPPFRIIMVYIYERTGSIFSVILLHTSLVFTTTVIVPMDIKGMKLLIWILTWALVLWIFALILYVRKQKIS